jgi:hypothetical protein
MYFLSETAWNISISSEYSSQKIIMSLEKIETSIDIHGQKYPSPLRYQITFISKYIVCSGAGVA